MSVCVVFLLRYLCILYYYRLIRLIIVFFKQKVSYEVRISDWSSDVCSSDLNRNSEIRDRSRTQQPNLAPGDGDDSGFKAVACRAPVDDQWNPPAEACGDMACACGADPAAGVGGRGGEGLSHRRQEVAHRRMGGRTNRYGGQAGRDYRGDAALRPQRADERERPGPETNGERPGRVVELRDKFRLFQRQDLGDEQIGRAACRERVWQYGDNTVGEVEVTKTKSR